jgi:hypothetical protein
MGIIRKTLSISTLGIVSFRSKKELLRRAEKDRRAAESELDREQAARVEADRRVAAAEKRVQQAELTALREAKVAAKAKTKAKGSSRRGRRRARRRGGDQLSGAREMLGDLVAAAQPVVQDQAKAAGRGARKAAKAARQTADTAQREATRRGRRARARVHAAEHTMAPHVEAVRERASSFKDEIVDLTSAATAEVKERAEALRDGR